MFGGGDWVKGSDGLTGADWNDKNRQAAGIGAGQAEFAPNPSGNWNDSNIEHHVTTDRNLIAKGNAAQTHYDVRKVDENSNGSFTVRPNLNWYVRPEFKNTHVVKAELEHVQRYLYWQQKGDGADAIKKFNRDGGGLSRLNLVMEAARQAEHTWHLQNLHGSPNRHDVNDNPELKRFMSSSEIQQRIQSLHAVEEPFLGD
jgi:hypothetical protein